MLFTLKIVSNIEFDFVLDSKDISEVDKSERITIKGYNKIADWCYQKLVKGNVVAIQGK